MREELKTIKGGLTPAQVRRLSPEVRAARAAYLRDSGAQLDDLFRGGVTELRSDNPDKDEWAGSRKRSVESLDFLTDEVGYQIDEAGNIYGPAHPRASHRARPDDE